MESWRWPCPGNFLSLGSIRTLISSNLQGQLQGLEKLELTSLFSQGFGSSIMNCNGKHFWSTSHGWGSEPGICSILTHWQRGYVSPIPPDPHHRGRDRDLHSKHHCICPWDTYKYFHLMTASAWNPRQRLQSAKQRLLCEVTGPLVVWVFQRLQDFESLLKPCGTSCVVENKCFSLSLPQWAD